MKGKILYMTAEELMSKAIQQEVDRRVLSQLLEMANVTKEESEKTLEKMRKRDNDVLYRYMNDITNESIHQIS